MRPLTRLRRECGFTVRWPGTEKGAILATRAIAEDFEIHLPEHGVDGLDQDEEFFEIEQNGERRKIRFHDYDEIFSVPGLYERLFAVQLQCQSPKVVVGLLGEALEAEDADPEELRAIDLGAGNGMVGEELADLGATEIVGVDLIEEARDAAERDRPGVYDAYHALDITDPPPGPKRDLAERDFNCMTCVAALGFGDMPPAAFLAAYDLVDPGGWVAFNIRDQFIDEPTDFSRLIDGMLKAGELAEHRRKRYLHRLSVSGEGIDYVAIVARKSADA